MTIDLYPGVGKTEIEIQRITELASLPNAAALPVFRGPRGILHITTRSEVESMDFDRLVASYGPRADLKRIKHLLGRTSYTIAGYEDDARELYEIPEIRRYYSSAFELCPALIVAADLRNECLRAAVFCVLENLNVIHRLDTDRVGVQAESHALEAFFLARLRTQATLHKRLGWSKPHGVEKLKTLENYLGVTSHEPDPLRSPWPLDWRAPGHDRYRRPALRCQPRPRDAERDPLRRRLPHRRVVPTLENCIWTC